MTRLAGFHTDRRRSGGPPHGGRLLRPGPFVVGLLALARRSLIGRLTTEELCDVVLRRGLRRRRRRHWRRRHRGLRRRRPPRIGCFGLRRRRRRARRFRRRGLRARRWRRCRGVCGGRCHLLDSRYHAASHLPHRVRTREFVQDRAHVLLRQMVREPVAQFGRGVLIRPKPPVDFVFELAQYTSLFADGLRRRRRRGRRLWRCGLRRRRRLRLRLRRRGWLRRRGLLRLLPLRVRLGRARLPVDISKFHGAFVLSRRVVLHAIDATPARRRGGAGSSPLDGASTAASSPRNDLVKNCQHPIHCLIYAQATTSGSLVKSTPSSNGPRRNSIPTKRRVVRI